MSYTWNPFTGNFDKVVRNLGGSNAPSTDIIPAMTTKVIDSVALVDFDGLQYDYVFSGNSQSRIFKASVVLDSGQVFDQVYNRGGGLSLSFSVDISGSNLEVTITNPNAFDINAIFTKNIL